MKHFLLKHAAYVYLLATTLAGCGGKLYGYRKKVRVKDGVSKTIPKSKTEEQKLDIVPNTHYGVSKPVEEKKKTSVISVGNPSSSAMVR